MYSAVAISIAATGSSFPDKFISEVIASKQIIQYDFQVVAGRWVTVNVETPFFLKKISA